MTNTIVQSIDDYALLLALTETLMLVLIFATIDGIRARTKLLVSTYREMRLDTPDVEVERGRAAVVLSFIMLLCMGPNRIQTSSNTSIFHQCLVAVMPSSFVCSALPPKLVILRRRSRRPPNFVQNLWVGVTSYAMSATLCKRP